MKTWLEYKNGKMLVCADNKLYAPLAYTTYFDECGEYTDFAEKGYKMYFVNVSFTDLPINNITGFTPFRTGVFEGDTPDYSEFDENIQRVLSVCPDAMIFPRINISMPRKWIAENPRETVETPLGTRREAFHSQLFRTDGTKLLKRLLGHIRSASYASSIAGYQVCGGTTQEWFHHDLSGSFSETGLERFNEWLKEECGYSGEAALAKDDFYSGKTNEAIRRYAEFSCMSAAKTAEYFSSVIKDYTGGEQIVGVFYGYNAFVNDFLWGHQGLRHIIDSPYIDFFSSPCAYDNLRQLGVDWGDMLPVDSVKLHKKLSFIECDIRTCFTKRMQDSRPGMYPDDIYTLTDGNGNKTVWQGPENVSLSLSAIRKAFAHQLTKGNGIWWFDMWGGWYHDEKIMAEIEKMKDIVNSSVNKDASRYPSAEVVLFIDERGFANLPGGHHLNGAPSGTRAVMSKTGIPFDICIVEDAERLADKYRVAIFTAAYPSECGKTAKKLFEEKGVSCIEISKDKTHYTVDELREILVSQGVHCYNTDGHIIYADNGYLGVHSTDDGEIEISLPESFRLIPLLGEPVFKQKSQMAVITMKKYDTVFFELEKI